MTKPPAFQFYVKDFLEGTAAMNNSETGAYIKLLCHQWLKDGLSNDISILTRLCNGDSAGIEVALNKFKKDRKGRFKNARLEIERKAQEKKRVVNSKNGYEGAQKKWHSNVKKDSNLNSEAKISPSENYSTAAATASAISKQAVVEIMRRSTGKNFSDDLIDQEADLFIQKYRRNKIGNLASLIGGWMAHVEPDIKPKKMVL